VVRAKRNLNYLVNINKIKDYLRDSPKTDKAKRDYLLALDKFFPYLAERFKDTIEDLEIFDLQEFYKLKNDDIDKITLEWDKKDINNKIFDSWKALNPEKKANILMKWVKDLVELEEQKPIEAKKTERNTFLNYMWRIQGFLSKLGRDFEANPKNLDQLEQNGTKIGSEIDFNEVVELYDKLNNDKYKIFLKILMYSGLNPIDILDLKPQDFIKVDKRAFKNEVREKIGNRNFYYVKKYRIKTKRKNVQFLIVFAEDFYNEIKNFFERKLIINPIKRNIERNKGKKNFNMITEKKGDKTRIKEVYFKNNWIKDKKSKIFGSIKPNTAIDSIKYTVKKYDLNPKLQPLHMRRLCFTLLQAIFPLKDKPIYDLWSQHKIGNLVDEFYITNYIERILVNYIDKIESLVLIDNLKQVSLKVNGYKEKVDKIYNLEKENEELKQKVDKMEEAINKANEIIPLLNNAIFSLRESNENIVNTLSDEYKIEFENLDFKDLDLLNESISKASTDNPIPKEKEKEVKGFNLQSK